MKYAPKHLIAASLMALGFAAAAQTPAAPAPQGGPGQMQGEHRGMREHHGRFDPAKMQERMARRQAALKQKLQITPAQESAWTAFTTAMKPPANMQRPNREEFQKLTTPERIDRMRAMRSARMAEMDKRADATKAFYATLSPEQKKVFDAETARGRRHGERHHKG
ncbi:Spy/CpxP family protein refolding chaperone [Caenimonas aquaedulcis]|uniref:Spy/CpxP family protein refolding chaperone n=1 Tax=Caenimonas aquaedulcis TaxID=2793270 RepID=A0A931H5W3_9BURK|nr:Spy/CpxP family protein refolding chaperone [Caenimonas aquaedulcis]MBG9389032.1 Spy/CpxP family protein refolding chaperone [Caenimonas aquaedulcis]